MNKLLINLISASRIVFGLLFLIVVIFYNVDISILVFIFILTAFSDYIDGKLARRFSLASDSGARFDVICDFIFIMLSTFALVYINQIPFWFLCIIVLKLVEFFTTSGDDNLKYEWFGHLVALMFYAFPIFAILINSKNIILILTIFISICAIVSSVLRIKNMRE